MRFTDCEALNYDSMLSPGAVRIFLALGANDGKIRKEFPIDGRLFVRMMQGATSDFEYNGRLFSLRKDPMIVQTCRGIAAMYSDEARDAVAWCYPREFDCQIRARLMGVAG
jgi:hypothetical protein